LKSEFVDVGRKRLIGAGTENIDFTVNARRSAMIFERNGDGMRSTLTIHPVFLDETGNLSRCGARHAIVGPWVSTSFESGRTRSGAINVGIFRVGHGEAAE
jgi:hypothetical protein